MKVFIKKLDQDVTVPEWDALPAQTREHLIQYGWTQCLSDAAASVKFKDLDESATAKARVVAKELIDKRLENLANGQIRATREGVSADPVKRKAHTLAIAWVQANPKFVAWAKENGLTAKDKDFTSKLSELAKGKAEAFMAKAAELVAQERAIQVDVSDIEL